jgi:ComF family protein
MKNNALDGHTAPPGGVFEWRAIARFLRSPTSAVSSPFTDLVTTVFPADCRACGGPLLPHESFPVSTPVCSDCLSHLLPQSQTLPTALCRLCGESLGMESSRFAATRFTGPSEGLLCTPCRTVPPPFARAVAYGVYEDHLREMIHLLKYEGMTSLAKPLGAKLGEGILMLEREEQWTADVTVVAVPLFAANQRQRGFNQSVLLADAAISFLRKLRPHWTMRPNHSLLRRIKATESQFNLSTRGRRRNLIGAFAVETHSADLAGRDVLLLDDIYTTGATSRACSKVLKRAGVRHVWVATLARAQREHVALWNAGGNPTSARGQSTEDDFG